MRCQNKVVVLAAGATISLRRRSWQFPIAWLELHLCFRPWQPGWDLLFLLVACTAVSEKRFRAFGRLVLMAMMPERGSTELDMGCGSCVPIK